MQGIGRFQSSQAKASTPAQAQQFRVSPAETGLSEDSAVSFHSELPQPLQQAMVSFIERCPFWCITATARWPRWNTAADWCRPID